MTSRLRTSIIFISAAFLIAGASLPSQAAQLRTAGRYDGVWSVVIQTTRGNCPAAVRAGVRILGGRVLAEDQSYEINGRVASSGAVHVMVSAAGQSGGAFGRLSRAAGRGRWQTSSAECSGEWTAARRD